jgi:hypothetical protein
VADGGEVQAIDGAVRCFEHAGKKKFGDQDGTLLFRHSALRVSEGVLEGVEWDFHQENVVSGSAQPVDEFAEALPEGGGIGFSQQVIASDFDDDHSPGMRDLTGLPQGIRDGRPRLGQIGDRNSADAVRNSIATITLKQRYLQNLLVNSEVVY